MPDAATAARLSHQVSRLTQLLDASPADCSDGILPMPASFAILGPGGIQLLHSDDVVLACAEHEIDFEPLREAIDRLGVRARNNKTPADPFGAGILDRIRFAIDVAEPRIPQLLKLDRGQPLDFGPVDGTPGVDGLPRFRLPILCRACMDLPREYDCPVCQSTGRIDLEVPADPEVRIELPRLCPHGLHDADTCLPCQRDAAAKSAGMPTKPARPTG